MTRGRIPASLVAAVVLLAVASPGAAKDSAAFDKLKSLAGVWEAKGLEGESFSTTFKVIAGGTAVMEQMGVADMVNIYHLDGDRTMVTHYCAGNNQPRMVAAALSADGKTLAFEFMDVTNRSGAKEGIMKGLKITFNDADHITQEWDSSDQKEPHMVITYQKKK